MRYRKATRMRQPWAKRRSLKVVGAENDSTEAAIESDELALVEFRLLAMAWPPVKQSLPDLD
jgi:hypothetical protein